MNDDILKILKYFDFSEKEAQIYLTMLTIGRGTAYEIAKMANIKRPTVYVLAQELVAKNILTAHEENNKTIYTPLPPKRLLQTWKGRVQALEATSIDLQTFYQNNKYHSGVTIFTGENGIDAVYNELTPRDTKGETILLFGTLSAIREKFDFRFSVWRKVVKNKRNKIKELINLENGCAEYAQHMKELNNPHYQIRITTKNIFGKCDNIIYKNKIAIFSIKEELFVTVIDSAQIAKTYQALFAAAWREAKKI